MDNIGFLQTDWSWLMFHERIALWQVLAVAACQQSARVINFTISPACLPARATLRLAKAPSHSRRSSFRPGRMFAMSSSTAAGVVRAGPTNARVSRKTTVSAMAGRVGPARVSVRARASSVMGARVVTARYVRQSRRNLGNAASRAIDRDRARVARPASPRAFPAHRLTHSIADRSTRDTASRRSRESDTLRGRLVELESESESEFRTRFLVFAT